MADRRLTASTRPGRPTAARPLRRGERMRAMPGWLAVVLVYAASRVPTTALLLAFAARQPANPGIDAQPGYLDFAMLWDARWYASIAAGLYPAELPVDPSGHVAENAWAFLPVYPLLVRGLMALTALPFAPVAVAVAVLSGLGTALVLHRILLRRLPPGTALFGVVVFCVAPLSPVLQVAYAEALQLLLLAVALLLVMTRRYGWLLAVVPVLALTRPTGLAFALALGLHVAWRLRTERAGFAGRERTLALAATGVSALAGVAWPLVAAAATGSLTAYPDTELAWRAAYVGRVELVPFTPWVQGMTWWFGPVAGPLLLVAVVALAAAVLLSPPARRLGRDLGLWNASYLVYLLAVFFPQSSTWRLLMPLFPLAGAVAVPRHPLYRGAVVVAGVVGQAVWLHYCWWVDGADWTPP